MHHTHTHTLCGSPSALVYDAFYSAWFLPSLANHTAFYASHTHTHTVWLAVCRYHNKVNMHHDWDLINIEVSQNITPPFQ